MTELMVSLAIFTIMMAVVYALLFVGQRTWFQTESNMEMQAELRKVLARVSHELQESGFDASGANHVTVFDDAGPFNSDILRFAVPIICSAGSRIIDASGDISYWGAPLIWGCTQVQCMDPDGDCMTREYRYIEYGINSEKELERRVLDTSQNVVRTDIFAQDISDFQSAKSADQKSVSLTVSSGKKSSAGQSQSMTTNLIVFLRNEG